MHLDLETDNIEAEVQRLETLGAARWDHQQERGYDFWVMRDPWGNEFCVRAACPAPSLDPVRRTWHSHQLKGLRGWRPRERAAPHRHR
jgi:hypothetical protein